MSAAEARRVALSVRSRPSGASVLVDGALLGSTPITLESPTDHEFQLTLEKPGHQPTRATVCPTCDAVLEFDLPAVPATDGSTSETP